MNTASTEQNTSSLSKWMVELAQGRSCASIAIPVPKAQQELRKGINACVIDSLQHFIPMSLRLTVNMLPINVLNRAFKFCQSDWLNANAYCKKITI